MSSGIENTPVHDVAMASDGFVYLATRGGGVFRSTTPVVTAHEPDPAIPNTDMLVLDSYPNPTNGTTSIRLELDRHTSASIDVVNILGQIVANPFDGTLTPGIHTVRWNAADLAPGTYFYKYKTDSETTTRKLLIGSK